MVEQQYLLQALIDLGYTYNQTAERVTIRPKAFSGVITFQKNGNTYECAADWMMVRGIDRKTFLEQVAQLYAYHATLAKLAEQGFTLVNEEVQEGNRLHLQLRRMA
jgi:hypothetical protein